MPDRQRHGACSNAQPRFIGYERFADPFCLDVRSWHKADMKTVLSDVRLSVVKRTSDETAATSAFDPKRTSAQPKVTGAALLKPG
jgi:hypothetical protein